MISLRGGGVHGRQIACWHRNEFTFGKGRKPKLDRNPDAPMRMLVLGDFAGTRAAGRCGRGPSFVRCASIWTVFLRCLARSRRTSRSNWRPAPFTIAIRELEDFHPDRLFASLEFFTPMRELRRQLQDPKTFALAAAMVGSIGSVIRRRPAQRGRHGGPRRRFAAAARQAFRRGMPAPQPASVVDAMIREAVAPHIVGKSDPRQADLVAAVDGMTASSCVRFSTILAFKPWKRPGAP